MVSKPEKSGIRKKAGNNVGFIIVIEKKIKSQFYLVYERASLFDYVKNTNARAGKKVKGEANDKRRIFKLC